MTLLQTLSQNKNLWQKNAVEEIKNRLILFDPDNQNEETTREEKLVVIYGNSQVGKTTVILTVLGISDKNIKEVSHILRGGREAGKSSTSTAVLYKKSQCDKFGIAVKNYLQDDNMKITYYSAEDFMIQIQKVRDEIEKNPEMTEILVISIPDHFFNSDAELSSDIAILDLPGDESNDKGEREHVKYLLKNYLAVSSVNIIAVTANNIQSDLPNLGTELQGSFIDHNWMDLSSRYIVLTTHSYSEQSRKDYFKIPFKKRERSFYDYIKNEIKKDFTKMRGFESSKIQLFPLDVGDSFNNFLTELNDEDRKEVEDTRNKIIHELTESIQERQSNSLFNIINSLKENIESYSKELKNTLYSEEKLVHETIEELNIELDHIKTLIPLGENKLNNSKAYLEKIPEKFSVGDFTVEVEKQLFTEFDGIADNKDNFEQHLILRCYEKNREELIKKIFNDLREKINLLSESDEIKIDESFLYNLQKEVTDSDPASSALYSFIYTQGMIFHFKNKPSNNFIKRYIHEQNYLQNISDKVSNRINWKYRQKIKDEIQRAEDEVKKNDNLMKDYENRLSKANQKIKESKEKLELIQNKIKQIEKDKNHDNKVFNDYMKIINESIKKESERVFNIVKSDNTPGTEKIIELLSLSLEEEQFSNFKFSAGD